MENEEIKVYRIGPIAAFEKGAHSVSQIMMSNFFGLYGIESNLYLRRLKNGTIKQLSLFLGVEFSKNLHISITPKHKSLSSVLNFLYLFKDLIKNRHCNNWVFLSKAKHVIFLSKFKKLFNFKIAFENHRSSPFNEAVKMLILLIWFHLLRIGKS